MKRLCLIPARGGSKRFKRKNIALLNGKPLIVYSIETALESKLFDSVVVSTEDEEIGDIAVAAGAKLHRRDAALATDTVRLPDVCLSALVDLDPDNRIYAVFCLLQPTCPLRSTEDLARSLALMDRYDANYVMSMCEFEDPPFWAMARDDAGFLKFYWGNRYIASRDSLPALYRHNGSIIWSRTEVFRKEREFMAGSRISPYLMPYERSVDIDHPISLEIAECLLNRRSEE